MKFLLFVALLLWPGIASAQELFPLQQVQAASPGCQDADTLSIVAPWAKCDPAMSDDFDRDGGVLNTAKWYQAGVGNPGVSPCVETDGPVVLDSQGIHWKNINTGGSNFTESGDLFWNLPGVGGSGTAPFYSPGSRVLEYKIVSVNPANNNQNYWVNWTWGKDASAGAEVDIPEDQTYSWIYWSPTWQPGGGFIQSKGTINGIAPLYNGGSHIVDLVRIVSGGMNTDTIYYDGVASGSFTGPQPVFADSTDGLNLYAGNEAGVCFPWDDVIQYVHVGH